MGKGSVRGNGNVPDAGVQRTLHGEPDFRRLFERGPSLYMVLDPQLHILAVSDAYAEATMIRRGDVLGRYLFDIFPDNPDDDAATGVHNLQASLQRVLQTRQSDTMAVQKYDVRSDEDPDRGFVVRYWSPVNSPVLDEQGEVEYIVHRAKDVTEYILAQQASQDRQHQELLDHVQRMEAEVYTSSQEVVRANERLHASNGELRAREEHLRRLATELEIVNAEIASKNQMLEESSRLKTEFLSSMSHELRTPLNAVIGFSEILKDGFVGELTPQQRTYIGHIFDGGQHLLALINDILDLSKIESGKTDLEYEATDLGQLLSDSLLVVEEKARGKRVDLQTELAANLGRLTVDPRRLKQILHNLLSNAVKFTPMGGQATLYANRVSRARAAAAVPGFPVGRRTTLPDGPAQDYVEISVRDTGVGMRSHDLQRLFTPFTQIANPLTRGIEGTGLGLAIVRRLAELHGGAVAVSSEIGGGSCFTVWLPWREPASLQVPQSVPAGAERVALVIEDDDRAATLMRLQLENQGFRTRRAASAEEALALSADLRPDLITLDIELPGMDGWTFLDRMQTIPRWADVPVVVVSVDADPTERGRAHGCVLGSSMVLHKPISQSDIRRSLDHLGVAGEAFKQLTVLVVDDDAQAVERVAQPLHHLGCVVLRAYGGAEGIELARRCRPDLILLDLQMPEVSGFEVVEALKEDPASAAIPIVVVTGRDVNATDRRRLSGRVRDLSHRTAFDQGRFAGEVQRAMGQVTLH